MEMINLHKLVLINSTDVYRPAVGVG